MSHSGRICGKDLPQYLKKLSKITTYRNQDRICTIPLKAVSSKIINVKIFKSDQTEAIRS